MTSSTSAVLPQRVLVTGIGMVTPIGLTASRTWAALCAGATGTTALSEAPYFLPACIEKKRNLTPAAKQAFFDSLLDKLPCKVASPVRSAFSECGRVSFAPSGHVARSAKFVEAAVDEALRDAGLLALGPPEDGSSVTTVTSRSSARLVPSVNRERVGVQIGVGIPSVADVADVGVALFGSAATEDKAHGVEERRKRDGGWNVQYNSVHPFFISKILGNTPTSITSIRYGITGPTGSGVAACATGAMCIGEAAMWVRYGRADVVITGATEACISPTAIAGFSRMRALSTGFEARPSRASRPFDVGRTGFVMGEGAGILVLESQAHAARRGAGRVYAELRGYGLSSDAHHVAAPDPAGSGAERCIRDALRDAGDGVSARDVRYVNAHATGTIGDPIELAAISRALGRGAVEDAVCVSSSKGALGHLLGAAGSVEAAIAVLALHHGLAPPNANMEQPCWDATKQRAAGVALVGPTAPTLLRPAPHAAALSTSFGFGGMNTSLLFTRCQ